MPVTRRDFLRLPAGVAAAYPLSWLASVMPEAIAASRAGTTLEETIVKGALWRRGTNGAYYRLKTGPGERHIRRRELGGASSARITSSLSFVHFTDLQLTDAQSPIRAEFTDRYSDVLCEPDDEETGGNSADSESGFRAQETLTLQTLEAMIRRVRDVRRGPVTGCRFAFVMSTGDNIDNEQFNELRWFIDLMDGGRTVTPNSGGSTYEGVQLSAWGDQEYWHPDPVPDKFKRQWGFPDYPGLLSDAIRPFRATGVGVPWLQTFGNHDGLIQGNVFKNAPLAELAVGPLKFLGLPPGANPCDPFVALPGGPPIHRVTPDTARRVVDRPTYVAEHFRTTGRPVGHGFTKENLKAGTAYYVRDEHPPFRFVCLDTVNPGGHADGSIGATQFAWLERRLIDVSSVYYDADGGQVRTRNRDRLVLIFSHHGLEKLNNPIITPDPLHPGVNDLPRVMGPDIEALLHRFPNVFAWVNGHTHKNLIVPRPDPARRTPGFWDITTAAHIDWNCQARIVELAIRANGRISIFTTMLDHKAPPDPRSAKGVLRLASIERELAANDPHKGFESIGAGSREDRNVELTHPGPRWLASWAASSRRSAAVAEHMAPV
ncbi:MAG: TIGR03767 family metallophosphoesterase [Actinomycetota bacterium]